MIPYKRRFSEKDEFNLKDIKKQLFTYRKKVGYGDKNLSSFSDKEIKNAYDLMLQRTSGKFNIKELNNFLMV
jgi:hypothetical protein